MFMPCERTDFSEITETGLLFSYINALLYKQDVQTQNYTSCKAQLCQEHSIMYIQYYIVN